MQTERVSKSARGDKQRLELWNTLLPEIRKALKEVTDDGKKKDKSQGAYRICMFCFIMTSISNLNVYLYFTNQMMKLKKKILILIQHLNM